MFVTRALSAAISPPAARRSGAAVLKLTVALHRALGKLNDADRRRNREEVLQRLEQHAGKEIR